MIRYEYDCVGCPEAILCVGDYCPFGLMPHHYCDKCGGECDNKFSTFDGYDYCEYCLEYFLDDKERMR